MKCFNPTYRLAWNNDFHAKGFWLVGFYRVEEGKKNLEFSFLDKTIWNLPNKRFDVVILISRFCIHKCSWNVCILIINNVLGLCFGTLLRYSLPCFIPALSHRLPHPTPAGPQTPFSWHLLELLKLIQPSCLHTLTKAWLSVLQVFTFCQMKYLYLASWVELWINSKIYLLKDSGFLREKRQSLSSLPAI